MIYKLDTKRGGRGRAWNKRKENFRLVGLSGKRPLSLILKICFVQNKGISMAHLKWAFIWGAYKEASQIHARICLLSHLFFVLKYFVKKELKKLTQVDRLLADFKELF